MRVCAAVLKESPGQFPPSRVPTNGGCDGGMQALTKRKNLKTPTVFLSMYDSGRGFPFFAAR